jgi:hypothetical protein
MTTFVAIVIIGLILLMIFQKIKFHLQWKQVYTAIGSQRNGTGIPSYDGTQYDIYVKKKEIHKVG